MIFKATSTPMPPPADAAIALKLANGGWNPAADVSDDRRITSLDVWRILQAAADAIEL